MTSQKLGSAQTGRLAVVAVMIASLAVPALSQTGTVQPFTQAEKQQGQQAHAGILAEFGGAETGTRADYIRRVGQGIAIQSGLSRNPADFTVSLLNSSVNNAFALPGGYIYVTRQLAALMNNEAELAGVLSHELGHTVARHSQQRQRRATRDSIFGVVGQVLGGLLGDNGGLIGTIGQGLQRYSGTAAQLLTLSYSRSQETEADTLGITYLSRAGYDPAALATVLASLDAQNSLDATLAGRDARSVPAWASTHPEPGARVARARAQATAARVTNGRLSRDAFLNAINGVTYGDDPRQGVVEGQNFLYPDGRFAFSVPQGFGIANGAAAVTVTGNSGQAQFTGGARGYAGDLGAYVTEVFRGLAGTGANAQSLPVSQISRTTVNSIPAAYASARANTQQGQVDVTVFAYEFSPTSAYHFVALTPVGGAAVFDTLFGSVRRMSAAEAAAVRPRRISVVTVPRGATLASMARQMAYSDRQAERFSVLNALPAGAAPVAGQRVKLVTYATR